MTGGGYSWSCLCSPDFHHEHRAKVMVEAEGEKPAPSVLCCSKSSLRPLFAAEPDPSPLIRSRRLADQHI
ncbi:hypothetical protein PBY51_012527 [Eleginops maclovinus]|uniref:Uncharacterized protein n=1 Tax=Eleginops maclovinus TaxID=56733 RepID=A0AAN7XTG3_ELEMC|nr:hypothetical protein PBY51_012527 [Eleginops maclovinus]